jgi:hypothetical protein
MISLLVVIAIAVGAGIYYLYYMPVTYIGIDINPSVELSINRMGKVIDAVPLNDEADILLSDLDLDNMDSEDAIEKIVDGSTEMGYINELAEDNAISVSVSGENEEEDTETEEEISSKLKTFLNDKNLPAIVLLEKNNDERRTLAETYGISNGKMLLIQKAIAVNPDLVESELATQSVQSIAKLIKAARKEIIEANVAAKKQQLIDKKEQIENTYRQNYEKAVQTMIEGKGKSNANLTEAERNQIIEEAKNQMRQTLDDVQDEINNNQSNIPTKIKDKIKSVRGRWSNSKSAGN